MFRYRLACAATLVASATLLPAQGQLLGGAATTSNGLLQRQSVCGPATTMCTPILGLPPLQNAGGSGYDPMRQVLWDTDGLNLIAVSAVTTACTVACGPIAVPGIPVGTFATGLAFEEDGSTTGALWCIDDAYGLQRFTWAGGCPVAAPPCSVQASMPSSAHRTGGLAISEVHGMIFYSASDFYTGGPVNNWILGAPLSNPCTPTCRLPAPINCGALTLGAITGLAFDDCTSTLYMTDGWITFSATFALCSLTNVNCCAAAMPGPWYGLCVEPVHAVRVGVSCLTAPCANCPGMQLNAVGDASLGNNNFGYQLTGGPPGAIAFAFANLGTCSPSVPALCGIFFLAFPAPFPLPPPIGLVGGACAGTGFHPLPIPLNPTLCGLPIGVQDVIVCISGSNFGTGLSNAVCTRISDT